MTALTQDQIQIVPVYSLVRKRTVFLEISSKEGSSKLCVKQSKSVEPGTLNRFWTVWLRQLILDAADASHQYTVRINDDRVWVSGNGAFESLHAMVYSKALQIKPLKPPPMERDRLPVSSYEMRWWLQDGVWEKVEAVVNAVLPRGAEVYGGPGVLYLERRPPRRGAALSLSELGKLVEWQVAQACA
jgi:hypothetical protein